MRVLLPFLAAALLSSTALAQTAPAPAQMGITSSSVPEVLQVLDSSKVWTPIGVVDPVQHVFTPTEFNAYDLMSFGARCDGLADDTGPLNALLAMARPGVKLILPSAQKCNFSAPLVVGGTSGYTIEGAGPYSTTLNYVGADPRATLFTVNASPSASVHGVALRDFRIASDTRMNAGFALETNGCFSCTLDRIVLDGSSGGNGKLWGGYWANGAALILLSDFDFYSNQHGGDGIEVNSASFGGSNATANLYISKGSLLGFGVGAHVAGGFGGFTCLQAQFSQNGISLLVDDAVTAIGNREIHIGLSCPLDNPLGENVVLNDPLATGPQIDLDSSVQTAQAGNGVHVIAWPNGVVNFGGTQVFSNCGDGFYTEDGTVSVNVSAATPFNGNGSTLGGLPACAAWKAANPGHGYGINSLASLGAWNSGGFVLSHFYNNAAGNIGPTARITPLQVFQGGTGTTVGPGAGMGSPKGLLFGNGINNPLGAATGTGPSSSGTCAIKAGSYVGGAQAGKFQNNAACSGATFVFALDATMTNPNDMACSMYDQTTPLATFAVTASGAHSVTFKNGGAAAAANDWIFWQCTPF